MNAFVFPRPTLGKILTSCANRAVFGAALVVVDALTRATRHVQRRAYNVYLTASDRKRRNRMAAIHDWLFAAQYALARRRDDLKRKAGF